MKGFLSFLFVALIAVLIIAGCYNGLVNKQADVTEKRAQIEAQLQRRFDLVPNLVESVKGAMKQEQAVFTAIADARTKYAGAAPNSSEKIKAGSEYESAIGRLLVVMENYPQLTSIDTVKDLMTQLEGTENRVTVSRERYNESTRIYNEAIKKFPTVLIARFLGFSEEPMFQSVEEAKVAPKVQL